MKSSIYSDFPSISVTHQQINTHTHTHTHTHTLLWLFYIVIIILTIHCHALLGFVWRNTLWLPVNVILRKSFKCAYVLEKRITQSDDNSSLWRFNPLKNPFEASPKPLSFLQKYIQKRLIILTTNGDNVYFDIMTYNSAVSIIQGRSKGSGICKGSFICLCQSNKMQE